MTLSIKNDPARGMGFVLLVVDKAIRSSLLEISVFNRFKGLYLGRSVPGKPNWTTTPSQLFGAARISGDDRSTAYCSGPDITTFIPEGAVVAIASSDGAIDDEVAWEGINIRLTWDGIGAWVEVKNTTEGAFSWDWDPQAVAKAAAAAGDEADRAQRESDLKKTEDEERRKQEEARKQAEEKKRQEEAAQREARERAEAEKSRRKPAPDNRARLNKSSRRR